MFCSITLPDWSLNRHNLKVVYVAMSEFIALIKILTLESGSVFSQVSFFGCFHMCSAYSLWIEHRCVFSHSMACLEMWEQQSQLGADRNQKYTFGSQSNFTGGHLGRSETEVVLIKHGSNVRLMEVNQTFILGSSIFHIPLTEEPKI